MRKILVVEDNEINQVLVTRYLRREGYSVVHAADGLQGVELAASVNPDLILMDLNLPELDGWEATRRIRANQATARIPIIALTAHVQREDVAKALEAGCDGYETKPVAYERLMNKIASLLGAPV
jgi:CheY-like chemotaxis protein